MTRPLEKLRRNLSQASELLHKHGYHGQGAVVDEILESLETAQPDHKRLAGIDRWGGAGAVWDVFLGEKEADRSFRNIIVKIAKAMDQLEIGTDRSRFIANTFQGWLDKRL